MLRLQQRGNSAIGIGSFGSGGRIGDEGRGCGNDAAGGRGDGDVGGVGGLTNAAAVAGGRSDDICNLSSGDDDGRAQWSAWMSQQQLTQQHRQHQQQQLLQQQSGGQQQQMQQLRHSVMMTPDPDVHLMGGAVSGRVGNSSQQGTTPEGGEEMNSLRGRAYCSDDVDLQYSGPVGVVPWRPCSAADGLMQQIPAPPAGSPPSFEPLTAGGGGQPTAAVSGSQGGYQSGGQSVMFAAAPMPSGYDTIGRFRVGPAPSAAGTTPVVAIMAAGPQQHRRVLDLTTTTAVAVAAAGREKDPSLGAWCESSLAAAAAAVAVKDIDACLEDLDLIACAIRVRPDSLSFAVGGAAVFDWSFG